MLLSFIHLLLKTLAEDSSAIRNEAETVPKVSAVLYDHEYEYYDPGNLIANNYQNSADDYGHQACQEYDGGPPPLPGRDTKTVEGLPGPNPMRDDVSTRPTSSFVECSSSCAFATRTASNFALEII